MRLGPLLRSDWGVYWDETGEHNGMRLGPYWDETGGHTGMRLGPYWNQTGRASRDETGAARWDKPGGHTGIQLGLHWDLILVGPYWEQKMSYWECTGTTLGVDGAKLG